MRLRLWVDKKRKLWLNPAMKEQRRSEDLFPEELGKGTDHLINEFLKNNGKRPDAQTPIGGFGYGSLEVTYKGTSSQTTRSELIIKVTDDKDTYRVTLLSKRRIGTDIFEAGEAKFIHEQLIPGSRTEIKKRLDGTKALDRIKEFFTERRFINPTN